MKIFINQQFLKFVFIGIINTGVHGIALLSLVEAFGFSATLSHLIAFMIANSLSYTLNCKFTFTCHPNVSGYMRFFSASLLVLFFTLSTSMLFEFINIDYRVAFMVIIFVAPALSFILLKLWAFAK